MSRSLAKDRYGVGPRKHRRTSSCGRDCWVCHGPRGNRADRKAQRRESRDIMQDELATVEPANACMGSCAYCDADPVNQARCYE